ncbi:MAG: Glycerone kinase [Acidimicrobiaceae bacterium]|nr:Glycerone kinase [Acidimicrobiaceae bacterium]
MSVHRHFVNDPRDIVTEALSGMERAYPRLLRWNREPSYVTRAGPVGPPKVALLAGGGSGHEPLHTGFVGVGMLDAAVPGAVFASPAAVQVEEATKAVSSGRGVLYVVKNYTGDVVNFNMAAEFVAEQGIEVRTVLVDDDLATDGIEGGPGRRGTAAVVTVEKVCGAAAERGANLGEVAALGARVAAGSRSLAVALGAGTHPGDRQPSFELAEDEVEYGVGIHGERGIGRRPFAPAADLARMVVNPLVEALALASGDAVIVIVNGLGSTHPLELSVMFLEVARLLDSLGIEIAGSLVGSYVTSLDMAGCSVTLTRADEQLVELWEAPVRTPALTW